METIGEQKLWPLGNGAQRRQHVRCTEVRKGPAVDVGDFVDLATKVAELQFLNRDFVLLFRGQNSDHKNRQRNTSLKPGLFRSGKGGGNPTPGQLMTRFSRLAAAEQHLVAAYQRAGLPELERL